MHNVENPIVEQDRIVEEDRIADVMVHRFTLWLKDQATKEMVAELLAVDVTRLTNLIREEARPEDCVVAAAGRIANNFVDEWANKLFEPVRDLVEHRIRAELQC